MSNTFVWMATRADAVDESQITGIHWQCELFNETGKAAENTGSFSLLEPISIQDFSKLHSIVLNKEKFSPFLYLLYFEDSLFPF